MGGRERASASSGERPILRLQLCEIGARIGRTLSSLMIWMNQTRMAMTMHRLTTRRAKASNKRRKAKSMRARSLGAAQDRKVEAKERKKRDERRKTTYITSMLNFLYKVIKKGEDGKGERVEALLENLFNTEYTDLKYLEVLKEILLQTENGLIFFRPAIQKVKN